MRISVEGTIYQKPNHREPVPNHSLYAMLMNRLPNVMSLRAHEQKKNLCLFTYSAMTIDFDKETFQFYFSAQDAVVEYLIDSLETNVLIRVDNYYMKVSIINVMPELEEKGHYLFKGKVLISNGEREVIKDTVEMEKFLSYYAENKLAELGLETDLKFMIYSKKTTNTLYRRKRPDGLQPINTNIPGHYITVGVAGPFESIKALYDVGFGQNTGTGNGLLWEVTM